MCKKSFFLSFLFILLSATLFSQVVIPDPGDVNSDGSVSITDALLVAQKYTGLSPSTFLTVPADVNCDMNVTIIDALLIAQYYVGLVNTFEECNEPDIVTGYGEVVYLDVEGGCFSIWTDEGNYEPLNLPEGIGLNVPIIFMARIRPDLASICMVGTIVEVLQADPFF